MARSLAAPPQLPPIVLQPKQRQLLDYCTATGAGVPTTIGFGGARGGAKSGAVRRIALVLAATHAGTTVHIIQRTSKDLYDGHIVKFRSEFPELGAFWSAQRNEYALWNGSRIAFRYGDTADDIVQLTRGPEPTWAIVDQAELFSEQDLLAIKIGVRNPNVAAGLPKLVLTFNPGGPSTAYLRRIFHTCQYKDNENPAEYAFIKAVGWDNYEWFRAETDISPADFCDMPDEERFQVFIAQTSYGRMLWALPESQRLGQLYGSFDKFEGQYFSEVWEESSIVLPVNLINQIRKPWWPCWLATDWGFSHFASTFWLTSGLLAPDEVRGLFGIDSVSAVRVIVAYRELVCNDVAEPDLARLIVAMTPETERRVIRNHWIGHDAFAKRGSAHTVAEQMDPILRAGGLQQLDRADIERMGGWRLMWNAWNNTCRFRHCTGIYEQELEDTPLFFVSAACPEIMSAIPLLICKEDNPQDIEKMDGQVSDDVADGLRYALKSYMSAVPGVPKEVERQNVYNSVQDPSMRAMAMLRLEAEQAQRQYIRRRARA